MDRELSPDEIESLLPAYALDAVDEEERAAIEAHLGRSPADDREVARFQAAASLLAFAGGAPPEGVWEKLEARLVTPDAPASSPELPSMAPVADLDRHRSRPPSGPRPLWRWVAAAAAVAALVVGVGVWAVARDGSGGDASTAAMSEQARHRAGARTVALVDASGATLATAVVLRDGTGYLESALPALPRGRTYQLWGVGTHETVSLGVLGRDPSVIAFSGPRAVASLAVTDEVAGGVVASTQDPVAVGNVRT